MATLRDRLINSTPTDLREFAPEQGMGDFRRGLRNSLIGTDINSALADESSLRADGNTVEADKRRRTVDLLRQQQSIAPVRVQGVEDVNGVGDAIDFVQGGLGSAAGSMAAPIAAGVGTGVLGTAMQAIPNPVAKAVGAGLRRYGTAAAPFAINQEQMKGGFYGQASADPTLMANTSAQDLNRIAEGVGVAGGALDTLLPAAFARSAVGLGMRGVQNVGLKTLGGSAMEGATEIGEGEIGRQVRGVLNPDQDTSGFALDRINEGVLGAIGGAPVSLGAAALDSTYDAGQRGVERAGDLAGTTMDLLGEKAGPAMDAAKTAAGPAMDAAKGFFNSARGKVVDLGTDDVVGKLKAAGKTVKSGWDARREEMDIISGEPPAGLDTNDPEAYKAWWDEASPKRSALIVERVQRLADEGDEQAAELLGNIAPGSDQGIEDAAKYLGENLRVNEVARAAERAGDVLGKIVRGTGRVAGEFGKATWNAATKKSRQRLNDDADERAWASARQSDSPGDSARVAPPTFVGAMERGEFLKSGPGTQYDVDAARNRNVLEAEYDVQAAKARSLRRAKLMGEYLSAVAEAEKPRYTATRAENVVPNFMKDVGGELSDLVESWRDAKPAARDDNGRGTTQAGPMSTVRTAADSRGQQFDGLKFNLNRIATQLVGAYGDNAPKVAADLRNMVGDDPQAGAILELLEAQVAEGLTPAGRRNTEATRRAAAEEILAKLPQEAETRLLGQGINLRSDEGKRQLLGMVESIVTGRVRPEARSALSQLLGEDTLTDMAEALAVPAQDTTRETSMFSGSSSMEESLTDSGLEMTEDGDIIDAYETKQAEKSMAKGSGTKYYGFAKTPSVANSAQARDPFGYTTKLTAADRKARLADGDKTARRRPTLLVKGKLLNSGQDEIEHRIGLVQKYLDGKGGEESLFKVTPRKVSEVMDDLGVQPAKRLTLFADYMMQEGGDLAAKPESRETGERMQEIGRTARKALLDAMEEGSGNQSRTTPGERKLVQRAMDRYFDSRYVVTGEAMTDVDPDKISMADFEKLKDSGYIAYNEARGAGQNKSAVMDEDNLLTFKQDGDEVYIKAKDLAAWSQRTQRDRTKSDLAENDMRSATDRDREFVADLLTGISALVATGQVDGMPTRMSAKGVAQSFARGVPPNLLLPSGNRYAKLRSVPVETDNVPVDDTDTVAVEQDRDYYTPGESVSGETREGQSKDGFEAQRRTSRQQGFDAKNPQRLERSTNARAAAGEVVTVKAPTGTPADLSTPKKFLTGLQQFRGIVEGLVIGTPEVVGGYAPNKTQRATLLKVRAREFEQYTEALAGFMQKSSFTPKQKETISKTMAAIGTALNAAPKTAAAPAQKTAPAADMSIMERAIAQRQEFLNNPPADYTSEKGVEVGKWAEKQLARVEADLPSADGVRKDTLRGYKSGLERIIAKAAEMAEGDASLAGFEGNASPKEGGAPLGKPVGGRKLNVWYGSGENAQFSNLAGRPFTFENRQYRSVEHAYQSLKSGAFDLVTYGKYNKDGVKIIGTKGTKTDGGWNIGLMNRLVLESFKQNPDAAKALVATGDAKFTHTQDAGVWRNAFPAALEAARAVLGKPSGQELVPNRQATGGYIETLPGTWVRKVTGQLASRLDTAARNFAALNGNDQAAVVWNMYVVPLYDRAKQVWLSGGTRKDLEATTEYIEAKTRIATLKLMKKGGDVVDAKVNGTLDQIMSTPLDIETSKAIGSRVVAGGKQGAPLSDLMDEVAVSDLPPSLKAIAKSVRKVAGEVRTFSMKDTSGGSLGYFADGKIFLDPKSMAVTHTAIHEGVHAATMVALRDNPELHQAAYNLLAHVVNENPAISEAYGTTNTFEFFAEGLSNLGFMRELARIKPSRGVEKYLGQTVANAWDAFVALVRKGLNLKPEHQSALTQLIELSGRAMKETASAPDKGVAVPDLNAMSAREMVSIAKAEDIQQKVLASPHLDDAFKQMVRQSGSVGTKASHVATLLATTAIELLPVEAATLGRPLSSAEFMSLLTSVKGTMRPAELLPNRQATGPRFNKQNSSSAAQGQPSSMDERAAAVAYVKKVLGPKIKVQFEKNMGFSGEWVDATETIRIATTSVAGSMQIAYHEALHGFFSKFIKNDPKAFEVFKALGDNLELTQRVHALLAGHPAAQAQLVDGEERIAYMYQFWAAGMLDLPHGKPRTLFQKVKKFFRAALGMVSDTERAVDILHAFHAGEMSEPSAAGKVIAKAISQGTWTRKNMRRMDAMMQKAAALTMPAESVLKVSASETAQKIGRMFFANPGEETEGTGETGYLNAREQMSRRYTNEFSRIMAGMSDRDYAAVGKYMNEGIADPNTIASVPHREAVVKLRALLQRFREYMVNERGMKIGDLGPLYYPRVWNLDKLLGERDAFMKMMAAKYPDQDAEAVYNALTENLVDDAKAGRPRDEDGVLAPMNRGGEERVFSWMDAADAAPFLEDSLVGTLTRYFHEGVRAAEYTHRFGQTGDKLETMLAKAALELTEEGKRLVKRGELADAKAADAWHARQMRDVRESVGAMEGTLGKDISGAWRKTTSWVMVYQNIRLLPLSLFSSVVDPLGLFARGAEFKDAMEAFTRGITEVGRSWADMFRDEPKARQADKWERLAEYVGSVDAAIFDTQVADMYASTYLNPTAKAINDKFFKINGMEGWNRGMRVGATRAAVKFIERHSGLPEAHSERWMTELGLTPADVTLDKDGNLLVSVGEIVAAKGISRAQARVEANKLHTAINRWVTGAVLTPNAAQRPAWSSDPHYSMFFHLKQFTYSFHQTIIKRVYNEMQHGNLAPLGAMAWYIPVMIASDITKGVMQGGGELPAHMKAMDAGEWVLYAAERGGLAGLGQLGIDANQDLASIGGPMVEQIVDSFSDPLDRTAIKAMPANAVYANWVD